MKVVKLVLVDLQFPQTPGNADFDCRLVFYSELLLLASQFEGFGVYLG